MNLPNRLTVLRIVMVPFLVVVWLFPYETFGIVLPIFRLGELTVSFLNILVLFIFCIASLTDFLDGYIARKENLVTTFGKFADPIADKLLVNTIFLIAASKNLIPIVPVVLMLGRDIVVDGCRMLASRNGIVVAAGVLGKAKTVLQMMSIIVILLNNIPFEYSQIPMKDLLLWFAAFVSVASGYSYYEQLREFIFESM